MKKILSGALLTGVLMTAPLLMTASGAAWDKTGHRVIGEIAQRHVKIETLVKIKAILGRQSLAEVSTWADEMKSSPGTYWRKKAGVYHYMNIPKGMAFNPRKRNPRGDVFSAFDGFVKTLHSEDASKAEKAHALKFLVHIVGDMHQPLHFGHKGDRGGNSIKVKWFGGKSNLHQVWDSKLIGHEKLSFSEWVGFIDVLPDSEIKILQNSNKMAWMKEALALRKKIYKVGDGNYSWNYIYKYRSTVRSQLQKGGYRLAGVLDAIFAK
jgi:hypothetical protein